MAPIPPRHVPARVGRRAGDGVAAAAAPHHHLAGLARIGAPQRHPALALAGIEPPQHALGESDDQPVVARGAAEAHGADRLQRAPVEHEISGGVEELDGRRELVVAQRDMLGVAGGGIHREGHQVGREQVARLGRVPPQGGGDARPGLDARPVRHRARAPQPGQSLEERRRPAGLRGARS